MENIVLIGFRVYGARLPVIYGRVTLNSEA